MATVVVKGLKLIVRTMWWYHCTKTANIFWATLDVAVHGAGIKVGCVRSCQVASNIVVVMGFPVKNLSIYHGFKLLTRAVELTN